MVAVDRSGGPLPSAAEAMGAAQKAASQAAVPDRVAAEQGRGAVAVAGAAFLGFIGIFALVRAKRAAAFDVAMTMRLQAVHHPSLAAAMSVVSWVGFPPQSRIIPPALAAGWWTLGFRMEAVFQVLAWFTGLLSTIVKAFMKRPRPAHPEVRVVVAPLGGSSFPSGHTITYVGVYGFLAYALHSVFRPSGVRRLLVGFAGALVALVGPSRIYQGHHWPTDVVASYLLGMSYLLGLSSLHRRLKERSAGR